LSEKLYESAVYHLPLNDRYITAIIGPGLRILGLIGTRVQDDSDRMSKFRSIPKFELSKAKISAVGPASLNSGSNGFTNGQQTTSTNGDKVELVEDKCPVCLSVPESFTRNPICGHLVCNACMFNYFNATGPREFPLHCLTPNCQILVPLSVINEVLSDVVENVVDMEHKLQEIIDPWLDFYLRFNQDGFRTCRNDDCGVVLISASDKDRKDLSCNIIFCQRCRTDRCADCGNSAHQGMSCFKFYLDNLLPNSMKKWKQESESNRRFCPTINCHVPVEKSEGCNHMICEKCGVHFCWLCESFIATRTDEIYKHIEKTHGPSGDQFYNQLGGVVADFQELFVDRDYQD